MYINDDSPTYSFRTAIHNGKRILLVGGFNHKRGAKINLSNSYNYLEQKAKELYPDSKVLYKWNTHDSISLDKIPYIGEFSTFYPNVYVATGFKKWGMTSSNVAANIITDKILGKENKYEDIYTPLRLRPIKNRKEFGNMLKESSHSLLFNKLDLPSATPKDIEPGEGKIVNDNGIKVGIYKDKSGKEYKIIPKCMHLGYELSWNNLDTTWDCPCHGSRYTYEGKLIYGPSKKDLKKIK
jgi:Rieske Fe-S protein